MALPISIKVNLKLHPNGLNLKLKCENEGASDGMKKAKSSYDLAPNPDLKFKHPTRYPSSSDLVVPTSSSSPKGKKQTDGDGKHKVVIYFSDAYNNICNKANGAQSHNDIDHANRLANEMQSKAQSSENLRDNHSTKDFMTQLKTVLEEKSKFTHKFDNFPPAPRPPPLQNKFLTKPAIPEKPNVLQINQPANSHGQINEKSFENRKLLPSFIESIDENNVIKLKIEQNFKKASELVNLISTLSKRNSKKAKRRSVASNETSSIHELNFSHEDLDGVSAGDDDDDDGTVSEPDEGYFYDWSFVQEWRSR